MINIPFSSPPPSSSRSNYTRSSVINGLNIHSTPSSTNISSNSQRTLDRIQPPRFDLTLVHFTFIFVTDFVATDSSSLLITHTPQNPLSAA